MATELNPPPSPSPPQPQPQPQPSLPPTDPIPTPTLAPKRHRRPSVRLGDIGDQPSTHRTTKPWRLHPNPNPNLNLKTSKTRPLTNLVTNGNKFTKHLHNPRPSTHLSKKLRIHDPPPTDNPNNDLIINQHNDVDFHNDDQGFQDFDPQGSDNDHDSADDVALLDAWRGHNQRSTRVFPSVTTTRVSDSRADMGLDHFPESDSGNKGGSGLGLDDGVRNWLVELGLGQYAPFFEIHEVDEEVLPHLTLDDLKDMGINAVGTRRKLYFAIQKLGKSTLS